MLKWILMFIFSLLVSSCFAKTSYTDLASKLVRDHSKEVKKKYGLCLSGQGGSMPDAIQSIFVNYSSTRKVDVDIARELFIEIGEELIRKINDNEEIRPFLGNYPFTFNNIELDLSFLDQYGNHYQDGHITFVFIMKGVINYAIEDPTIKNANPLVIVHKEPYEEALRIAHGSKVRK